jgi:thioesterase domain-containing protein
MLRPFEYRHEAVSAAWTSAEERYRPKSYPGNVALFQARDPSAVLRRAHVADNSNGWHKYVTGSLEIVGIDSDHTGLVHAQHAATTAVELERVLREARR